MMIRRRKRSHRRGAAMVEAAIVLPVFLTLALGMMDLGYAVFQYHLVSEASRQAARIASVHGSLASTAYGQWSSSTSASTMTTAFQNAGIFAGLNTSNVTTTVSWPHGSNQANPPSTDANGAGYYNVQVTVSTTWKPIMLFIFGNRTVTMGATSVMPIAH